MMPFAHLTRLAVFLRPGMAIVLAGAMMWCAVARGQARLRDPIYRVSNESAAGEPSPVVPAAAQAATPTATETAAEPFDFTQQPGEHPLMPFIRVAKASLVEIDQNIRDYSCTFIKRERIDGELGEYQHIFMKVRHEPFSVYMYFLQPFTGREVLYVSGQNDDDILVLESGWKRRMLGRLQLDPEGAVAMRGQRYPITHIGIRNLTAELIRVAEADTKFAESEVTTKPNMKVNGRLTTMVQIVHPVPRQNFRAYTSRVFFDNELRVPIHFDAYLWPAAAGEAPPLDECYTYSDLKINNNFTARDFDPENPEIFKTGE
jgi:hypothetical protein